MARIDHTGHAHPATPDGRRRCREARAAMDRSAAILAEREDGAAAAAAALRDHMTNATAGAALRAKMAADLRYAEGDRLAAEIKNRTHVGHPQVWPNYI